LVQPEVRNASAFPDMIPPALENSQANIMIAESGRRMAMPHKFLFAAEQ